jgi:hypothetical protein
MKKSKLHANVHFNENIAHSVPIALVFDAATLFINTTV